MKPFGLPKAERLSSKKTIDKLFALGQSTFSYPIKAVYLFENPNESDPMIQSMFIVPKKKFKRAVERNLLRRRIKESYRLNKHILKNWCLENSKTLSIAFIYIASEPNDFQKIEEALVKLLINLTQNK